MAPEASQTKKIWAAGQAGMAGRPLGTTRLVEIYTCYAHLFKLIIKHMFKLVKQGWETVGKAFLTHLEDPFIWKPRCSSILNFVVFISGELRFKESHCLGLIPDHPNHTICLK